MRLGARALIRAVAGALHQPELLDVSRDRRLRRLEPGLEQTPAQLLLAVERLALDQFENRALAAGFHGVAFPVKNTRFLHNPRCNYASIFIDRIAIFLYKYSFRCILVTSCQIRGIRSRRGASPAPGRSRVAVAGATGYTGQELLRLLSRHPGVVVTAATSSGATAARRLPALARLWDGAITPLDPDALAREADVVFLALPDTAAAELAPRLVEAGVRVIDLSGAFRLRDAASRARWYPETHAAAGRSRRTGLTELQRERRSQRAARRQPGLLSDGVAAGAAAACRRPACWSPTSDVIVDAKSGVSGAGKTPSERTHFSEVHGSLSAYGVFGHRHGAEIEQGLGRTVTFTPHLVPLDRGILATIYVRVPPGTTEEALGDVLRGGVSRRHRSCGWSARRCRKSSTSRTRTSATSAGASIRRAARFSSR